MKFIVGQPQEQPIHVRVIHDNTIGDVAISVTHPAVGEIVIMRLIGDGTVRLNRECPNQLAKMGFRIQSDGFIEER
jgi:hypothetical protein